MFSKSNLKHAIKLTEDARSTEGGRADELFQSAYRSYHDIVSSDPNIVDALYHWGTALFQQGLNKTGMEAEKLFRGAGERFCACLVINPAMAGAAIDWGVALMEQARAAGLTPFNSLYDEARERFQRAEEIQRGSASYNLACIHALRNEKEKCLDFMRAARECGTLPQIGQILEDRDLLNVREAQWFRTFLELLQPEHAKTESVSPEASETTEEEQSHPKKS